MVKTPNRPTVHCKSRKKRDLKETFLFWDYILEKKTLTSLVDYSTPFSLTGITFQNKDKYSTQYNYSTLQLEYLFLTKLYNDSDMHAHRLDLLELLVDACYRLDRSEAMTKYKFVISTKGIMILVLWEESFKSLEADYSNHLASPLVASSGETSNSPRIRCGKIKLPR